VESRPPPAREGRASAGHNFIGDARVHERRYLFTAASEHERVATLEPYNSQPLPAQADEQGIDVGCRNFAPLTSIPAASGTSCLPAGSSARRTYPLHPPASSAAVVTP
jgi:hypothetical protein